MKKRRHHYVWRKYLSAWTENGTIKGTIWCFRDGKHFNTNLINVAQKRDFYQIDEFGIKELEFLSSLIGKGEPHLQKLNKGWVELFHRISKLKKINEAVGKSDSEINKILDEEIHNFEENLHSKIESDAEEYLLSILNEDISFYKTEHGCLRFSEYICTQYMRTQRMMDYSSLNNSGNINFDNIRGVLSHIFATNMGWHIYSNRSSFHMMLLKNMTSEELITADQPVINTCAYKLSEAQDDMELYYPVSPKIAVLITEKSYRNNSNKKFLAIDEVEKYNQNIAEQSHSQIYATSEKILKKYVN